MTDKQTDLVLKDILSTESRITDIENKKDKDETSKKIIINNLYGAVNDTINNQNVNPKIHPEENLIEDTKIAENGIIYYLILFYNFENRIGVN